MRIIPPAPGTAPPGGAPEPAVAPGPALAPVAPAAPVAAAAPWPGSELLEVPQTARALLAAWSGDPLVIVPSPPGAGKTRLVVLLAAALAEKAGMRVGVAAQTRAQAEQIARRTEGVAGVYNEIQVAPTEDPLQTAKDSWITARVRSDLMFDPDVRSGNYTIETDRQSVYLMGSARSQVELDRATQLARYVPGVERVVSYVDVRYGEPNGGVPATAQAGPPLQGPWTHPSGAGSYAPPLSGPSPSNAPIQVQKLN